MESTGIAGRVQVSSATYALLPRALRTACEVREAVQVKGKGALTTYVLPPAPLPPPGEGEGEEELDSSGGI